MNIIEENKEEINEILDALKNCNFSDLDQYCFEDQIVYWFKDYYKKSFTFSSGASKGVLIFKDFGFVIKIPFTFVDGEPLCGAIEGLDNWDYCSQEVNRYNAAEEAGLQDIFLKTELIDFIDDYPIYIQPYAKIFKDMSPEDVLSHNSASSDEDKLQTRNINEEYVFDDISNIWESEVLAMYGKDYYIKLKSYINDSDINDLRDANIGYYNNKPVLVDYAGFYD